MTETGLWGDPLADALVEPAEKTVSFWIDENDEEWTNGSKDPLSSVAWSLEDECSDHLALVNPLVVESMNSEEDNSGVHPEDSALTFEMNPRGEDDFNLFEFIFDDDRPLSDDQFLELIDNPELVHSVEGDRPAVGVDGGLLDLASEATPPASPSFCEPPAPR
jgi:hypothetical protein